MRRILVLTTLVAGLAVPRPASAAVTRHVLAGGSIQAAVNASSPGDVILVHEGVYREAVRVGVRDIIIRGIDRNRVELDGTGVAGNANGFEINAPGVEVSNLTVHDYRVNGVFWNGVDADRYWARYVTAFNNGLYGVFTFEGAGGVFEKSYASGHPDSGFYIGGCWPCDAVIDDVDSVNNALGYSGTNAGGNLVIRNSRWINNRGGILPNTLDSEPSEPQRGAVIVGNTIEGSGNPNAPTTAFIAAATGMGIGIVGGNHNIIERNTIRDSSRYGVVVLPYPTETPNLYRPTGNIVRNNIIDGSGLFDLALAAGSAERNCFSGNNPASSDPPLIETLLACGNTNLLLNSPVSGGAITAADLVAGLALYAENPCTPQTCPDPRPQPTMPNPTAGLP